MPSTAMFSLKPNLPSTFFRLTFLYKLRERERSVAEQAKFRLPGKERIEDI